MKPSWLIHNIRKLSSYVIEHRRQYWQSSICNQLGECGDGIYLSRGTSFVCPGKIRLGNNVHIGSNGWFQGCGGISIEENVHISRNVAVFSASHDYQSKRLPYDETFVKRPVHISRNVWIGMNVMIVPGITIGYGAVIGLGTVVVQDVPPLAIIGGLGQRILKYRDKSHYERLENLSAYGARGGQPLNE